MCCTHPLELQTPFGNLSPMWLLFGFLGGSEGKESACNAGDLGLIPGLKRSPGEEMATRSCILTSGIPWTE